MKSILIIAGIICLSLFANAQQVARSLTAINGKRIGFYEYKPKNYTTSKKYPLIIFLHGIGERGNGTSDLYKVNANATPRLIKGGNTMTFTNPNTGVKESFIVLCPQLDLSYGSWETFYVDEMLKYAKENLSIDVNRVFLTGISLGGGGVWKYATSSAANAAKFAGIIPCCGTGEGTNFCNLAQAKVAVWAFHAMDDRTVGVGNTQYAEIKLNQCNSSVKPKFTYYASGGHGIWERAFDPGHGFQDPNVYEWMLTLNRSGSANNNQGQDDNNQEENDDDKGKPVAPNVLPVANAGTDQTITLPVNSVTVDGSGSADSDGTIKDYAWSKVSGPSSGNITSPTAKSTQIKGLSAGTYVFQLKVTDNKGGIAYDNVTISVNAAVVKNNVLPVANAGTDQTITLPVNSVTVDGSGSADSDGTIKGYAWSKVSGPSSGTIASPAAKSTKITELSAGTYVFQLKVTDDKGGVAYDNVTISVNAAVVANKAPFANAGDNFSTNENYAYLSAGASYDPDGSIAGFKWLQVSGPNTATILGSTDMFPVVQDLITGVYVFKVIITDNEGATASASVTLTVKSTANKAPVASAGSDLNFVLPITNAVLDGSLSYDPDGTIVSYAWTKVNGPVSGTIVSPNAKSTQLINLVTGIYVFQLKITDNKGAVATDEVTVVVTAGNNENKVPYCNAGNDFTSSNNYVYLSGGASYDPDGSIVSFVWSQVSGPNKPTVLFGNAMFPIVQNVVAGTYVYKLVVTDNEGATASSQVSFTITQASKGATSALAEAKVMADEKATISPAVILSPNPATSYINLAINNEFTGKLKVVIYDAIGKAQKTIDYNKLQYDFRQQIDVTGLAPGLYYLQILLDSKTTIPTQKFIKL